MPPSPKAAEAAEGPLDPGARAALRRALDAGDREAIAQLHAGLNARASWAREVFLTGYAQRADWALIGFERWYRPLLLRVARGSLGAADAEDVVSRFCERFDRYAASEQALDTFPGYAVLSVQRDAVRLARRRARELPQVLDDVTPDPRAAAPQRRVEDDLALADALATLSPDHRTLVRERYALGMTLDEIAAQRGVSHQAVDQKLKRILARLHALLRHPAPTDPGGRP